MGRNGREMAGRLNVERLKTSDRVTACDKNKNGIKQNINRELDGRKEAMKTM